MKLDRTLEFCRLLLQFQAVERMVMVPGRDYNENDAEHSYALAMMAWFLVSTLELSLDKDLVIKYGLIHDLVEVYAGDTFVFDTDPRQHQSKSLREDLALKLLGQEYPNFDELTELIHCYEQQHDEESKFIYALDKIMPELVIYLDRGKSWKRDRTTPEDIYKSKADKISVSPIVAELWSELYARMKSKPEYF